jgi:hypothetical protein
MTMSTDRDTKRSELHATAGAVVAQLRDKLRAVEACETLLGAHALQTSEARILFDRVAKNDARDTEELQALLGKLHVSGHGPAASAVSRAAAEAEVATRGPLDDAPHDDAPARHATASSDEEVERQPRHVRNAASRSKE